MHPFGTQTWILLKLFFMAVLVEYNQCTDARKIGKLLNEKCWNCETKSLSDKPNIYAYMTHTIVRRHHNVRVV